MPDQLYLSYWLRGFSGQNMLRSFEKLLAKFPFSTHAPGPATLRVYALEFAEPALLETTFATHPEAKTIVQAAAQFEGPDCAYLVGGYWDLWQDEGGWKLLPVPVLLGCYGPQFDSDPGDHLRMELGLDSHFLPEPQRPEAARRAQSNIQSLLRLAREVGQMLPVARRSLWTESGEDFAGRVRNWLAQVDNSSSMSRTSISGENGF